MVDAGDRLKWKKSVIADKHCVGGLPGNRTTPIVVAIVAAAGITIPKTSSRAITSPAGTADTMRVMTQVGLDLEEIQRIVYLHNGCIVSGENHLSPADDTLIRVERSLDIDSEGQMIASVLSKKTAAGSTHLIIDIPVGSTAKVRSESDAERLKYYFKVVGKELGFVLKVLITDGSQPIGRGIGPALEAHDVLAVLRNDPQAPGALKEKSIQLAGELLELVDQELKGKGTDAARRILESGEALDKFMAICMAQGGFTEPGIAKYTRNIYAEKSGTVTEIDNRKLARIAKLAGAPSDPEAGVWFDAPLGRKVHKGDLLFVIHSQSTGELDYALNFLKTEDHVITIA
jgi:thymidine phosphorylase